MLQMSPTVKEWRPARFTLAKDDRRLDGNAFAVLILNQPLENRNLFLGS